MNADVAKAILRELLRRARVGAFVGARKGRVSVLALNGGWVLERLYEPPTSIFGYRRIVRDVRDFLHG